jgi:uncharacterized SAM-binding protein YcdF (DUF218 family)
MPPPRRRFSLTRTLRVLLCIPSVLLLVALLFVPFYGNLLVREDPLQSADAIFVLAGARVVRTLEGYELYRARYAPRILLSGGAQEAAEARLADLGVTRPSDGELARDVLLELGVPGSSLAITDTRDDNTSEEGAALRKYAEAGHWQRVIVVTSRPMRRRLEGSHVEVIMRASRYDTADPGHWWRHRADIRAVVFELPKLIAYALGVGG